jgi:hypothetical protein
MKEGEAGAVNARIRGTQTSRSISNSKVNKASESCKYAESCFMWCAGCLTKEQRRKQRETKWRQNTPDMLKNIKDRNFPTRSCASTELRSTLFYTHSYACMRNQIYKQIYHNRCEVFT